MVMMILKKGNIMKYDADYQSFLLTRIQGLLCLLVLLTWGFGDALTALYMIEQKGLMAEGNALVRSVISFQGASAFLILKISFTLMILYVPFIVKSKNAYWMINGYLISFIAGGSMAMLLNMQSALDVPLSILPQHVIMIYISSILVLTNVGELLDKMSNQNAKSYIECVLNDTVYLLKYVDSVDNKHSTKHA
jgi:hypothetical protein